MKYYNKEYGKINLAVWDGMWAWDFIYSYMMEFYLGEMKQKKHTYCMSIIEISDSGYFASRKKNRDKQNTETFAAIENSETLLLFIFGATNKKNSEWEFWDTDENNIKDWILSPKTHFEDCCADRAFLVMKVPMQKMITKENADNVISEFIDYVKEYSGIDLNQ